MRRYVGLTLLLASGILLFARCSKLDQLREKMTPSTPHEQYAQSLRAADLERTTLGRQWFAISRKSLEEPVSVELPFQEVGYFDPRKPAAAAYQINLKQGRKLLVRVKPQAADSIQFFVDLFRNTSDTSRAPEHVSSARDSLAFSIEITRTGTYLVRVQPELLAGGRYRIILQTRPSLAFPVANHDSGAIRSVFGDSREGGRRKHHGIDIFAPRRTPAVAAANGRITRTGTNELGGNVIWLRDRDRRQTYYYAHLDSQIVEQGRRVEAGDTLGLIGNTGNARHTPPHLHFGIYSRSPIDPFPYVHNVAGNIRGITTDTSRIASLGRIQGSLVNLRTSPSTRGNIRDQLDRHTLFEYVGASHGWYRVRLPDGTTGYVAASLTEPAETPVNRLSIEGRQLLHEPRHLAAVTDSVTDNTPVEILGHYNDFLFARTPEQSGWLQTPRQ